MKKRVKKGRKRKKSEKKSKRGERRMFADSVRSSGKNWDKVQYIDKKANDGKERHIEYLSFKKL